MLTEAKKVTRKKTLKPKSVEVSATPTNKHLKKIANLSKLGFLPCLDLDLRNKDERLTTTFNSVADIGKYLDKHALMYFDIPKTVTVDFPESSKDFVDLFFTLNTKYNPIYANQDKAVPLNRYRSLGEIYLTFKFYYSKMTWKMFLTTLLSKIEPRVIDFFTDVDDIDEVKDETLHNNSRNSLGTTLCGVIDRRTFSIAAHSGRNLNYVTSFYEKDEFGFTLKDYLDYIS